MPRPEGMPAPGYLSESSSAPVMGARPAPGYLSANVAVEETPLPSLFSDPIGALTSKDWWLTRPSGEKITAGQAVAGPALSALDMLTLGAGDEIAAGGNSILDYLSGSDSSYTDRLAQARGVQSSFGKAAPVAKTGLEIAAAFKNPLTMASKVTQMPTLLSKGFQLAKEGAAVGAAFGFNEGEGGFTERGKNSLLTGLLSGAAAPAIGLPIMYGTEAIANKLSEKGPQIKELLSRLSTPAAREGEAGAINLGAGSPLPEGYSPAELALARELKYTPVQKVVSGANEMGTSGNSPLFLPEAIDSKAIYDSAALVANTKGGKDIAAEAIGSRTKGAQTRASALFDDISKENSTYEGASRITKGAKTIIDTAKESRQKLADPLYKEAYKQNPLIQSDELVTLLEKDRVLNTAINNVKKTANNADLPSNSTKLLVKARSEIGNLIDSAKAKGNKGREVRDLTDTYNRLNNILHTESKALKTADAAYEGSSKGIDQLNSTFLSRLSSMTGDKVKSAGQVMGLSPERISSLRNIYKEAGLIDEWDAGIRSHLQGIIESSGKGQDFTRKIIGNTLQEDKLKAALGGKFDKVAKELGYENRMFEGKNKYTGGSPTAWRQADQKSFKEGASVISSIIKGDVGEVFNKLMGGSMSDDIAEGLAKIYFNPKSGQEAVNKIIPLLNAYKNNEKLAGAFASASGKSITESLAILGQKPQKPVAKDPVTQAIKKAEDKMTKELPAKPITKKPQPDAKIKAVEAKIDADPVDATIYEMESSRNPLAKNPESSASGAFQLIKSTAKKLGVKNVFDIEQNYNGYLKLKEEAKPLVKGGDPEDFYAVHYLGAPTYKRWRAGKELTQAQSAQVEYLTKKLLPRFRRIYAQKIKNKSGMVEA